MTQQSLHKIFIGCGAFLLGCLVVALTWQATQKVAPDPSDNDKVIFAVQAGSAPTSSGSLEETLDIVDGYTGKTIYSAMADSSGGLTLSIGKGDDDNILGVRDVSAAGDSSTATYVVYADGAENIRASFSNHASYLTITTGSQKIHTVTPRYASNICDVDSWPPSPTPRKTTQLLGITVSSDESSQNFDLPKPISLACDYDPNTGQMNPGFQDISTAKDSAYFFLADGTHTWMNFDPNTSELNVEFHSSQR